MRYGHAGQAAGRTQAWRSSVCAPPLARLFDEAHDHERSFADRVIVLQDCASAHVHSQA